MGEYFPVCRGSCCPGVAATLTFQEKIVSFFVGLLLPLRRVGRPGMSHEDNMKVIMSMREASKKFVGAYESEVKKGWIAEDIEIPRAESAGGGLIKVILHKPKSCADALPLVVWAHGGGMTINDARESLGAAFFNLIECECCWASIDYRLAPEARFPAAVDDLHHAFTYFNDPEARLKYNFSRVGLGGVSSGGILAGLTAVRLGTPPAFIIMLCPMVSPECNTESWKLYSHLNLCPGDWLRWSWDEWLKDEHGDRRESRDNEANLLLRNWGAMRDASPVLIVTARCDPLHDEGVALVEVLKSAGVPVEWIDGPGPHCLSMGDKTVVAQVAKWCQCLRSARSSFLGES